MQAAVWEDDTELIVERRGKSYTVPEPGYKRALSILAIINGEADEVPGVDGWRLLLGDVVDTMIADDCPPRFINRVYLAALALFIHADPDRAKQIIEVGLDPEALAALVAANQTNPEPTPSTPTAEASTTRTPASGSGTRTSRKRSAASPVKSQS